MIEIMDTEAFCFSDLFSDHFRCDIYNIYATFLTFLLQLICFIYIMLKFNNLANISLGMGCCSYILYRLIRDLIKIKNELKAKIDHFYDNHIIILVGGRRIPSRRLYKIKFYLSGKVRIVEINPELHIILNEPES